MADNLSNSTNKLKEEAKQNILDKDGIVADSTSVEVELIQTPNNVTSRKHTSSSGKERWSKLSQSVTKSEAISEDTKRVMAAYQSLDDLTVLPTKNTIMVPSRCKVKHAHNSSPSCSYSFMVSNTIKSMGI